MSLLAQLRGRARPPERPVPALVFLPARSRSTAGELARRGLLALLLLGATVAVVYLDRASYADSADECRSAYRHHFPPAHRGDTLGFRCVRTIKKGAGE